MKILLGDTNIFGIITDPRDHRYGKVDKMFSKIFAGDIELHSSEIVLEEIRENPNYISRNRQLEIFIKSVSNVYVVTPKIEKLALDLHNTMPVLRLNDAKIIITAVLNDLQLWTADWRTILSADILSKIQESLRKMKMRRLRYLPV